jgi:hypothetical protein
MVGPCDDELCGWKRFLEKEIEELGKNCLDVCCIVVVLEFIDQLMFISARPLLEIPISFIYCMWFIHRLY